MTLATKILLKVQGLPEEQQREVLRFIERLPVPPPPKRVSLYGLWRGRDTSPDEIEEARQDMWGGFPRNDF